MPLPALMFPTVFAPAVRLLDVAFLMPLAFVLHRGKTALGE